MIVVVRDANSVKVMGRARDRRAGSTTLQHLERPRLAFANAIPSAVEGNPDGMADLAIFREGNGDDLLWLNQSSAHDPGHSHGRHGGSPTVRLISARRVHAPLLDHARLGRSQRASSEPFVDPDRHVLPRT